MHKITADWIFPVSSPPLKEAILIIDKKGKILSIAEKKDFPEVELTHYKGILCPGFINTHCHLELSYLKNQITAGLGLVEFIIELLRKKNLFNNSYIKENIIAAQEEMKMEGIVAIGDIANTTDTFDVKQDSDMFYHTFFELTGFNPLKAKSIFQNSLDVYKTAVNERGLNMSIAPHAPYSVSVPLFNFINQFDEEEKIPTTMHNQESNQENIFYQKGDGDMITLYKKLNLDVSFFSPTRKNSLISIIPLFSNKINTLLVHNTYSSRNDITWSVNQNPNLWWCFCPNANLYIEKKLPDITYFLSYSDKITIGTDSYASNYQLSVLEELKTLQFNFDINLSELIQWATLNGAKFLNIADNFGSFETGKIPGVNLIQDLDLDNLKLLKESKIKKIL